AEGRAGTCHGGFLDPPQNLEGYCTCEWLPEDPPPDDPGGSTNRGYRGNKSSSSEGQSSGTMQPGGSVHLTATLPFQFTLTKSADTGQVSLVQAGINIQISSIVDGLGKSSFTVTGGNGQFASYVFGGQTYGASTFM